MADQQEGSTSGGGNRSGGGWRRQVAGGGNGGGSRNRNRNRNRNRSRSGGSGGGNAGGSGGGNRTGNPNARSNSNGQRKGQGGGGGNRQGSGRGGGNRSQSRSGSRPRSGPPRSAVALAPPPVARATRCAADTRRAAGLPGRGGGQPPPGRHLVRTGCPAPRAAARRAGVGDAVGHRRHRGVRRRRCRRDVRGVAARPVGRSEADRSGAHRRAGRDPPLEHHRGSLRHVRSEHAVVVPLGATTCRTRARSAATRGAPSWW